MRTEDASEREVICSHCGEPFVRLVAARGRPPSVCPPCRSAASVQRTKKWREGNREDARAYWREWAARNPERIAASRRRSAERAR